jgi:hypothetical protein
LNPYSSKFGAFFKFSRDFHDRIFVMLIKRLREKESATV